MGRTTYLWPTILLPFAFSKRHNVSTHCNATAGQPEGKVQEKGVVVVCKTKSPQRQPFHNP